MFRFVLFEHYKLWNHINVNWDHICFAWTVGRYGRREATNVTPSYPGPIASVTDIQIHHASKKTNSNRACASVHTFFVEIWGMRWWLKYVLF